MVYTKKNNWFFCSRKQWYFGLQKFTSYNEVLETNLCSETLMNTHSSLIIRPWCWMKSTASSGLLNINIRTMSSRGNAVDRGPTVCARFKICKALALTWIEYKYTKLLMILLPCGYKVHIAGFYTLLYNPVLKWSFEKLSNDLKSFSRHQSTNKTRYINPPSKKENLQRRKQMLTWLKYRCKRQLTRYEALFTNLKKRTKLLLLTAANAWTANFTSGELRTSARNCCTSLFTHQFETYYFTRNSRCMQYFLYCFH